MHLDGRSGFKRGRYSDPGTRNKEPEPAEKLESLITRVGEKVRRKRRRRWERWQNI